MDFALDSILLWGFVGTIVLTLLQALGQGLRLTRMSIPFLLGTMFTGSRERAMIVGLGVHFVNGELFSMVYALVFGSLGTASWWLGMILGFVHGLFALAVLIPMVPAIHPRMADSRMATINSSLLEPPGFLALNYGARTPVVTLLAHLVYGAILGQFYELPPM